MLSREAVLEKLGGLQNTQASIQATSQWLLFHRRRMGEVTAVWAEGALQSNAFAGSLLLLYLANDVMQSAMRKGFGEDVVGAFTPHLVSAVAAALKTPNPDLRALRRLIGVWRDRAVLPSDVQRAVEALLPPLDASEMAAAALKASSSSGRGGGGGGKGGGGAKRATASHLPSGLVAAYADLEKEQDPEECIELQRALADALFREAQLAVQELDRMERAQKAKAAPKQDRPRASLVQELRRNPKRLHQETLNVMGFL